MIPQIQALKAQAQAMVAMCDAMMAIPEEDASIVSCDHPSDRRVDVSTMGGSKELCMQCHAEVPQPTVTE